MDFEGYLRKKGFATLTIRQYVGSVNYFTDYGNQGKSYADMLEYLKYLQEDREFSKSYCKQQFMGLRYYFDYLIEIGELDVNPLVGFKFKGMGSRVVTDLLEEQELICIYQDYPKGTYQEIRNRVLIGLVVYQGLSTGELVKLESDSLDLSKGELIVPGSSQSNGRVLELDRVQLLEMHRYLGEVRPALLKKARIRSSYLLVGSRGGKHLTNLVESVSRDLKKRFSYYKYLKQLRQSRISLWVSMYGVRKAQYLSGHKYVSSTERYEQDRLKELQESINEKHPLK